MSTSQEEMRQVLGNWKKVLLGAVIAAALAPGLYWAYWDTLGYRFSTISPNRVYKSAALPPAALVKVVQGKNIQSVVDLRDPLPGDPPGGLLPADERRLLTELGVEYHHLPISSKDSPSLEALKRFLELSADEASFPMLIHCHHGEGRSVLFSALYRIEFEGWSNERARKATRLFHFRGTFGPNGQKGRFICSYTPRRRETTPGSTSQAFPARAEPRPTLEGSSF